jgi:hypothetical protein
MPRNFSIAGGLFQRIFVEKEQVGQITQPVLLLTPREFVIKSQDKTSQVGDRVHRAIKYIA